MTDKKAEVVSLSGSPIYHYDQAPGWEPVQGEICLERISDHIEAHLGPIGSVFHELVSDLVHIDVHFLSANDAYPYTRLVTSGMSDLAMTVPAGSDAPRHLELIATLPADWRLDQESMQDERWYWPVRLLKMLARFPHKQRTWLGWGHSIANGDPPEAYAANTRLDSAILLPSVTVPDGFHRLRIDEDKEIHFLAVVPLYPEERELKLRKGTDGLLDKFADLDDLIAPSRRNVAKKRFGLF
ncbi:suppressor of fused domain protein [Lysobacter sp. Root983]|uniref:suppressor of fused domain protein n=1 Tax=Lysobacter sp. Root983 TaxID=1736613 RepID=UPI00070C74A4|nr:suppressor of fused domain protein [Lysobacter sp. Root983]KRD76883.1 hypothetical protein ASE43_06760 [Lysobacter sp. Root983]